MGKVTINAKISGTAVCAVADHNTGLIHFSHGFAQYSATILHGVDGDALVFCLTGVGHFHSCYWNFSRRVEWWDWPGSGERLRLGIPADGTE